MAEDKRSLRALFKTLRDDLPADARGSKSQAICQRILRLSRDRGYRRFGVFWPLGSEVDLRPFVEALPTGLFYFPRVASTRPPRLLWGPPPLEPSLWGLQEPVFAQHPTPPVDLLLVPGLAFDPQGYRLGYGGGFYDALLDHLDGRVVTLAVGFEAQRIPVLPLEPMDQPVQGLVTEEGLTWFQKPC